MKTDRIVPGQLWKWNNSPFLWGDTATTSDGSYYLEPVSEARRQFEVPVDDSGGYRLIMPGDTFLIVTVNDPGPWIDKVSVSSKRNCWHVALLNDSLVWISQSSFENATVVREP